MNFDEWKEIRKKLDERYSSSISKNTVVEVKVKDKEKAINGVKSYPNEIVDSENKKQIYLCWWMFLSPWMFQTQISMILIGIKLRILFVRTRCGLYTIMRMACHRSWRKGKEGRRWSFLWIFEFGPFANFIFWFWSLHLCDSAYGTTHHHRLPRHTSPHHPLFAT